MRRNFFSFVSLKNNKKFVGKIFFLCVCVCLVSDEQLTGVQLWFFFSMFQLNWFFLILLLAFFFLFLNYVKTRNRKKKPFFSFFCFTVAFREQLRDGKNGKLESSFVAPNLDREYGVVIFKLNEQRTYRRLKCRITDASVDKSLCQLLLP